MVRARHFLLGPAMAVLILIQATASQAFAAAPPALTGDEAAHKRQIFAKIETTARCINQMRTYRSAIRFLEKRLERSPPSVTVDLPGGDSFTLLNRHHFRMQSHKRVLQRGMQARESACQIALAG